MEHKTSESTRGSPTSTTGEGPWWRWSHGKTGSIAASSSYPSANVSPSSLATSTPMATSTPESTLSETVRWQRRTTRTGLVAREEGVPVASWSSTPFASSGTGNSSPKFFTSSFARSCSSNSSMAIPAARKKASGSSAVTSTSTARADAARRKSPSSSQEKSTAYTEITWSTGTTKRRVSRREKKSTRSASASSSRTSSGQSFASVMPAPKSQSIRVQAVSDFSHDVLMEDAEMEDKSETMMSASTVFSNPFAAATKVEIKQEATFTTTTTFASSRLSATGKSGSDPLVDCARAVLQDCIRKRCIETSHLRKRALENCAKADATTKTGECSPFSCGSSSSDDELCQLSSLDPTLCDKATQDFKHSREEIARELALHDSDLSSSPDFDRFSPFFEEKGLPVEIRYQLPLALGTANETDKECTICQLRYGIGDHIVTLPCEHFFHACCVDKWLWNHTSCPLCRTEVSLDAVLEPTTKHKFNECPQVDQEDLRRKMRTQSTGFRPVVPALDELESRVASMNMEDEEECAQSSQFKYLVCPKPQRPQTN